MFLTVIGLLAALAVDPDRHRDLPDLTPAVAALQGEWVFESADGMQLGQQNIPLYRLLYGPDRYSLDLQLPGQEVIEHREYRFMLIPRTSPQAFVVWQDRRTEPYVHGILRVENGKLERLYTSVDNPRPRHFEESSLEYELIRTVHIRKASDESGNAFRLH